MVALLSEPQVGEQALPPAVRVQETPLLEESFCTVAFTVTAAAPAAMVVMGFVIVTEMVATVPVMVKGSLAVAEVSATDAALIVGALSGDAGVVVGGV